MVLNYLYNLRFNFMILMIHYDLEMTCILVKQ